jgi:hypothetical protein
MKYPTAWAALAKICNNNFLRTTSCNFLMTRFHIPADPRSLLRARFYDGFLGLSTLSSMRKALREAYVPHVVVGKVPNRNLICATIPLYDGPGKSAGFYLVTEKGDTCILQHPGLKDLRGFPVLRASRSFNELQGLDTLIKHGPALSVAGKHQSIVFKP